MMLYDEQVFAILKAAKYLYKKIKGFTSDDFKNWAQTIMEDLLTNLVVDNNDKLLMNYDRLLTIKANLTSPNARTRDYLEHIDAINYIIELLRPVIY